MQTPKQTHRNVVRHIAVATATAMAIGLTKTHAANVLTNGNFETGNLTGWTYGITPTYPNGGRPFTASSLDSVVGWKIKNTAESYFSPAATPISGFSAYNGFDGGVVNSTTGASISPADLVFDLTQPFTISAVPGKATLEFTFGTQSNYGGRNRTLTANILNSTGAVVYTAYSYVLPYSSTTWAPSTISRDITTALNGLGAGSYKLNFRQVIPEYYTGPAVFAIDNISLDFMRGGNWLNTTNTNNAWSTGSNWSGGLPPTSTDDATFNLAGTYNVNISAGATANTLNQTAGNVTFNLGGNTLNIGADNSVFRVNIATGSAQNATTNILGTGALSTGGPILIGSTGGNGTMNINGGATVNGGWWLLAGDSGGTGTINIDGAGTSLTLVRNMEIGGAGVGVGTITNGAQVACSTYLDIAAVAGSTGTLTVAGSGAKITAPNVYVGGEVSSGGTGTLTINTGGTVETPGATKVWNSSSVINLAGGTLRTGALDTDGVASRINWTGGTLEITSSASSFNIGPALTGAYTPIGSNVTLDNGMTLRMLNDRSFNVGANGTGSLTINSGGAFSTNLNLVISNLETGGSSTATVTVNSGGSAGASNLIRAGILNNTNGTLNVSGTVSAAGLELGNSGGAGVGTVNISAGSMTVTGTTSVLNSVSKINLTGGTLTTGSLDIQGSASRLAWSSGTIELTNSDAVVGRAAAPFNTFGTDTLVVGAGKHLILSKPGAVLQVGDNIAAVSTLTVNSGGTVTLPLIAAGTGGGTNGIINVDGATASLHAETVLIGTGGKGTINIQNGGTVVASGLTKVYLADANSKINLSGGTLNTGSLDLSGQASRLNWTGGTLELTDPATEVTLGANGQLRSSTIALGSGKHLITTYYDYVGNGSPATLNIANGGSWTVKGSGAGAIIANGTSASGSSVTVDGTGSNWTFTGSDYAAIGGYGSGTLTVRNGGTFSTQGSVTVGSNNVVGIGVGQGIVNLQDAGSTISVAGNMMLAVVAGTTGQLNISGGAAQVTGKVTANAASSINLSGGTLSAGELDLLGQASRLAWTGGTLKLTGGISDVGSLTVPSAGTLGGTGTVSGTVVVNGHYAPGNSPGTMTINGNLDFNASSSFDVDVWGTAPGTGYDQTFVNGIVDVTGALLQLNLNGFVPSNYQTFTIINNDGTDAVTGRFANVTDSHLGWDYLNVGGDYFQVYYNGGTGNDVVLVAVPEPATLGLLSTGVVGLLGRRRRRTAK